MGTNTLGQASDIVCKIGYPGVCVWSGGEMSVLDAVSSEGVNDSVCDRGYYGWYGDDNGDGGGDGGSDGGGDGGNGNFNGNGIFNGNGNGESGEGSGR